MKIKVMVSAEKQDEVEDFLAEHGIEVESDAEYMITENETNAQFLEARNQDRECVHILPDDIVFIESFGHEVELHTSEGIFYSVDRMYQLEEKLSSRDFLRISKSVIISRKHVKKIRPSLSMKFVVTMSDKTMLDVTRSYYYDFKRYFNI